MEVEAISHHWKGTYITAVITMLNQYVILYIKVMLYLI